MAVSLPRIGENLNRKALAFLRLASIRLMLRKLCNPACFPEYNFRGLDFYGKLSLVSQHLIASAAFLLCALNIALNHVFTVTEQLSFWGSF